MMPGFSLNWRRTSSTTSPPARPTDSIEKATNRNTIIPPISRPMSTSGWEMSKPWSVTPSLAASSRSSSTKAANSTSAASTAEPIA